MKKILGDDEYLWSYTKGFSELPSPAQVLQRLVSCLRWLVDGWLVDVHVVGRDLLFYRAVAAVVAHGRPM